ncbi:hypothetical protein C8J57DRAFT_1469322 [Mycena rebaudengoi]|nr:hypothetical protein C8J57DRAFT_1469322 [Mycena rebaudengoi]
MDGLLRSYHYNDALGASLEALDTLSHAGAVDRSHAHIPHRPAARAPQRAHLAYPTPPLLPARLHPPRIIPTRPPIVICTQRGRARSLARPHRCAYPPPAPTTRKSVPHVPPTPPPHASVLRRRTRFPTHPPIVRSAVADRSRTHTPHDPAHTRRPRTQRELGQSGVARAMGVRTCCMGPTRCREQDTCVPAAPRAPPHTTTLAHRRIPTARKSRELYVPPRKSCPTHPLPARLAPHPFKTHIHSPLLGGGAQFPTASAYPSSHERASYSPDLSDTAASRHHPTRSTCTSSPRDTTALRAVCPRARSVRERTAGPAPWHSVGTERAASQNGTGVAGAGVRGAQGGAYGGQATHLRRGGCTQENSWCGSAMAGSGAPATGACMQRQWDQTRRARASPALGYSAGVHVATVGSDLQWRARNLKWQEIEESASYNFHSPQRLGEQVRRTSNRTKRDWSSGECRLLSLRNHHIELVVRVAWNDVRIGQSARWATRATVYPLFDVPLRLFSSSSAPSHLFGLLLTRNLTGKKRQEGARLRTTCMLPCIVAAQMVLNTRNKAGKRRELSGRKKAGGRKVPVQLGVLPWDMLWWPLFIYYILLHKGVRPGSRMQVFLFPALRIFDLAAQRVLNTRNKAGRRTIGFRLYACIMSRKAQGAHWASVLRESPAIEQPEGPRSTRGPAMPRTGFGLHACFHASLRRKWVFVRIWSACKSKCLSELADIPPTQRAKYFCQVNFTAVKYLSVQPSKIKGSHSGDEAFSPVIIVRGRQDGCMLPLYSLVLTSGP